MIYTPFKTNVLIKDFNLSDDWNNTVQSIVRSHFSSRLLEVDGNYSEAGNQTKPFFTQENISKYSEIKQLKDMFVDGFYELAQSYDNNKLTKDEISKNLALSFGKFPFMRKGDYKGAHTHAHITAFSIFYLSDVDNKKNGGQLVLIDPTFDYTEEYSNPKYFKVETKKNRLIVCPNIVWHEVTPYSGDEERITLVVNLQLHTININV